MSHNVIVEGVEFTDLDILAAAVDELVADNGVRATFVRTSTSIRGYAGRRQSVDACIQVHDQPYDIGFIKQGDVYKPIMESGFTPVGFAAPISAKRVNEGAARGYDDATSLGQLVSRYALIQTERNARANRLNTRRVVDKAKGQIRLEVSPGL